MGKYYLYEHWRPDRGEPFYVGYGSGRRANVLLRGRNRNHLGIQAKLSNLGMCVEVRIVASGLTLQDALSKEVALIAYWRAMGMDLANISKGGTGGGYVVSEKTRQLMRARKLGRKLSAQQIQKMTEQGRRNWENPAYREKVLIAQKKALSTPEARDRLCKISRAQVRTAEHNAKISAAHIKLCKKMSPEHREKLRLINHGRASNMLGKTHSQATIDKIRKSKIGKKRLVTSETVH